MIYEIRNYWYEPARLADYREWVGAEGLPYLRKHLDIVGFWITNDEPAEVDVTPMDELGHANVTWIIRWPDIETRHATLPLVLRSDEWQAVFANSPGRTNYRRVEVRFADGI